jgi:hypothetical protein
MIWLAYARNGTEWQVIEDIRALGINARAAFRIEAIRRGKQRWPEAVTSAIFPNYVFVDCSADEWHQMQGVKNLGSTFYMVPPRIYERVIVPMLDAADAEYARCKERIEAGERLTEYQDGDQLLMMTGKLAGTIATFRRLVEAGEYGFPEIVAELPATLGGKPIAVRVDPLDAKKVASGVAG